MAKNHQIYNASLDEEMLSDLVRSVFDNEETGLFVLNERLSPHHPVFSPSLYLNRSHRRLEELLVLPKNASTFQAQLIALISDLDKPQFALRSSPYQINASLLAHRNVLQISFKPHDILALSKELYQSEIEQLRELHTLALKLKEPRAPFDLIRFQSQDRLALLRALHRLQHGFEDLYSTAHLSVCSLSKNYGQNKAALNQSLSLMQKTSASFREEHQRQIEEFLRSLQKHRQPNSIEVFLKWLKQELAKAENAREKLLSCQGVLDEQAGEMMALDPGLAHALQSYQSQNPLLSKAQIIDHWFNSNRDWQKKWMQLDPARVLSVAQTMEQKTNAFLKAERGLLSEFNRDALSFDAQSYLERYQTDYATIFRYFKPAYYRDKKALNAIKANPKFKWSVDETIENLESLILLQKQYNWLASFYGRAKELFGKLDDGLNTDFDLIYRQIELQKVYRTWSAKYQDYQVLLAQNKSILKNIKQDLSGLYQEEHTDFEQIGRLLDWLIDYFHTPYSSLAGARDLIEQKELPQSTLQKAIAVFDQYEKEIDGLKEFVQDRSFIRFKRALCSKPIQELKIQFRNLTGFERNLSSFNEALRQVDPESSLYELLKAIHFSIKELKNSDIMAAYQKQVLTSWLFAALSRLIEIHLSFAAHEPLTNELLKELLTILDMQYYSQRDEKSLVRSDQEWAGLLPTLLQSLYPIWLVNRIEDYARLERPGFDMVYFFSPVELSPKALKEDQDYFILDLQKPIPEEVSRPQPSPAKPITEPIYGAQSMSSLQASTLAEPESSKPLSSQASASKAKAAQSEKAEQPGEKKQKKPRNKRKQKAQKEPREQRELKDQREQKAEQKNKEQKKQETASQAQKAQESSSQNQKKPNRKNQKRQTAKNRQSNPSNLNSQSKAGTQSERVQRAMEHIQQAAEPQAIPKAAQSARPADPPKEQKEQKEPNKAKTRAKSKAKAKPRVQADPPASSTTIADPASSPVSPSDPAIISYSSNQDPALADPRKEVMKQIVLEQYPIHFDVLANEMLPHYGRKRLTSVVRKEIQKDLDENEELLVKNDYVYPKGYGEIPVRNLKRKLQHISDDEIMQALRQSDQKDRQKRILKAANLLGFRTTNTPILQRFGALLDEIEKE